MLANPLLVTLLGWVIVAQAQSVAPPAPSLTNPPAAESAQEIPSQANCSLTGADIEAGKHAYCASLRRYATFHTRDMDRFVAQVATERNISTECAKEAIEKAETAYLAGDPNRIVTECYQVRQIPAKCITETMHWAQARSMAGNVPSGTEMNARMRECAEREQP